MTTTNARDTGAGAEAPAPVGVSADPRVSAGLTGAASLTVPAGTTPGDPDRDSSGHELSDAPAHITVLESELLVRGAVWDVRRDRFEFRGTELVRDYIDHTGAVAVLALDDAGRVLLMRQYRHPIAHRDVEIPAGLMDAPGESGLAGAQRELAEEADLAAGQWDLLLDLFLSPGGSSETMRIFLARDLSPVAHDFVRDGEEAELHPEWVPLEDAVAAALTGRIGNAVTVSAVLAAHAARAQDWATLRDPESPWVFREGVRGERSR
ncbi:NUDIX domain-containing protein [Leucobacter salsicius]|uniref:NUDIX domain-containing protein n=1 Tax=Leucobacter salsicius TaxID=664638 RepID=UPI00034BCF2A|nr:NUDIX hydrolase [Leucobacter salsicius]